MPDWLFEFVNPWTTPAALLFLIVGIAWCIGIRGRTLAIVAMVAALCLGLWQAWKAGPPSGLLDLQIYTNSARAWVEGGSLYDYSDPVFRLSATYPPIGPLLFAIFTPFTADGREVLFTAVSLVALFGCAWSVAGLADVPRDRRFTWSAWGFAAAMVTIPVWLTLRQGQVNILLWFLVLIDLDALRNSRRWTGFGIGVATAIKLVPGLFLAWLVLAGRWAAALRALIGLAALTGLGWLLAPSDSRRYWTELLWDSERVGSVTDSRNNSSLSVIGRAFDVGSGRTLLWVIVCIALLTVAAIRSVRASRSGDLLAVAAIVGCASAAVSPISWTHHLGFLLVALAAFFVSAPDRRTRILCLIAWLVLVEPGGHGESAVMSTVRALLLVGAVCCTPIRSQGSTIDSDGDPERERSDQTETTLNTRPTKSALPSSSLFRRMAIPPITFAPRS